MPNGLPAFPQSTFPQDRPPTLFHPASPKTKRAKVPAEDTDNASIATTSTFSSKIGLLKDNVMSKIPASYKEHRARKDAEAHSAATSKEQKPSRSLPPDTKTRKLIPKPDHGLSIAPERSLCLKAPYGETTANSPPSKTKDSRSIYDLGNHALVEKCLRWWKFRFAIISDRIGVILS